MDLRRIDISLLLYYIRPMISLNLHSGTPQRFTLSSINIIVGNPLSQNGPQFQSSSYSGSIEESTQAGAEILTVSASGTPVRC